VIALRGGRVIRGVCWAMGCDDNDDAVDAVAKEDGGPLDVDGSEYCDDGPPR
jgi:hypothetical protein